MLGIQHVAIHVTVAAVAAVVAAAAAAAVAANGGVLDLVHLAGVVLAWGKKKQEG